MRLPVIVAVVAAALTVGGARAETVPYTIAVPPDARAAFEVPITVAHAGGVVVNAAWTGGRILSFRLARNSVGGPIVRRSGPSPQRIDFDVTPEQLRSGATLWTLQIRALAARDHADGTVEVTVPDAPEVVAAREEAARPPPPPPRLPDTWARSQTAPEGAPPRLALLFTRVDALRSAVFAADPFAARDACGWQDDTVRWLAHQRDGLREGAAPPANETLRYLRRVADAVERVDEMRTSENLLIAGPVPEAPLRRRAWLAARRDAIRPLERELDQIADIHRRGEVSDLAGERWVARFLACLTSSERHFETRVRTAPGHAEGAEIAESQWPRILAAAAALRALSEWREESAVP